MVSVLSVLYPSWNISAEWSKIGVHGARSGPQLPASEKPTRQLISPPGTQAGGAPPVPRPYLVWNSGRRPCWLSPIELRSEYRVGPGWPCRVVIRITPCPAREPEIAPEAAPL